MTLVLLASTDLPVELQKSQSIQNTNQSRTVIFTVRRHVKDPHSEYLDGKS